MKEGVSGAKPSCYGKTKKLSCSSSKRTSVSVSFPLSPHQQQRANYSSLHNPSATDYINKKKVFWKSTKHEHHSFQREKHTYYTHISSQPATLTVQWGEAVKILIYDRLILFNFFSSRWGVCLLMMTVVVVRGAGAIVWVPTSASRRAVLVRVISRVGEGLVAMVVVLRVRWRHLRVRWLEVSVFRRRLWFLLLVVKMWWSGAQRMRNEGRLICLVNIYIFFSF